MRDDHNMPILTNLAQLILLNPKITQPLRKGI